MLSKVKSLMNKLIIPVPVELMEQFSDMQLKNSINRIRILSFLGLFSLIMNPIIQFLTTIPIRGFFTLPDYILVAVIILFHLFVIILKKSKYKKLLWIICCLTVAGCYVLVEYSLNFSVTIVTAEVFSYIFFIKIFLFTIVPDFRPRIFITFAVLYYALSFYTLTLINMPADKLFLLQLRILNLFSFIFITKILLYNSKVKTFVNTFKINEINNNLEKMVQDKTLKIVELKNAVLETISELVERRDNATGGHISRTSVLLQIIINKMIENGLYSKETSLWNVEQMILSAQLHDVGKISIDDSILRKPGKLTDDEFEIMKNHTILGGEIIKEIQKKSGEREFLDYAYTFAVYHHEKWNGSGYPYSIAGKKIPLHARLMAIIDVYDALISERPYKKPFTHEEAIIIIKDGKGSHFDPILTELFLSVSKEFRKK